MTVIGKDIDPGIVIGVHMDTLDGRMQGAGDGVSGSKEPLTPLGQVQKIKAEIASWGKVTLKNLLIVVLVKDYLEN